ncbi:DUF3298 and DUF4163 domain-containing protein [Cellulosilyticum sp. I15G10I2]|uniref:DUF3298 and DUF4163 domain-containing protein n=1 Tax=Cellulosilyticum sp. I15G10I2 TaxID=1892843 RepID=UPI00085C98FC|nr:DUF3298 and DUF4163 domain-containing protein [Cellulosilyticum sp. I15G10I2]
MHKKAMYVLVITSLFINFNLCAKSKTSKDTPGTAIFVMAESNSIFVDTKIITSQMDEINLNISIPQIKGLTDKEFERDLNKTFLEDAQKAKKTAIHTAKSYNKDMVKDGLTPIKFEYISTFSVIEAPKPYLVIGFLEYQYSGGAHGISYQKYLNIRTTDNKVLALKDLFKENVDYKELINTEIKNQIQARSIKGEYFFPGAQGFTTIKDDQEYYINSSGDIVIIFNIYEIAPYAAGLVEFSIPAEKLASVLK